MPAERLSPEITLDRLLEGLAEAPSIVVRGLSSDSRRLTSGDVFLACQGQTSHGLDYLEQAIAAGVAAVVWDASTAQAPAADIPLVAVEDLAANLGTIANRYFAAPSERISVLGVTGTNGKTTVAYLLMQCLHSLGHKCAYIGTLGSGIERISGSGAMTTPACIELHRELADFAAAGAACAALEVSSHAIEQNRIDGVRFDTAIFTNLSRDHIDYHGSMRAYGETKARLFLEHQIDNRIVNVDSEFGGELAARCNSGVVTVSTRFDRVANGHPFVFVRAVVATEGGSKVAVTSSWGDGDFLLPLPGDFNVANAVAVLGALLSRNVTMQDACAALGRVAAPPGRMQRVQVDSTDTLPAVFVDYAHTPASLEAALRALRRHCKGAVWCVFGCGGDRDRGKRAQMGRIAQRLADHAVVTNDNPRSESPADIIADILEVMNEDTVVIEDRGAAIANAISSAGDDDIVLIAGKGHEDYQIIGTQRTRFSDYDVARANLQARLDRGATGR